MLRRAKGEPGKDAGSAAYWTFGATEDAARRRLAAASEREMIPGTGH
jgi:hypothetical protein